MNGGLATWSVVPTSALCREDEDGADDEDDRWSACLGSPYPYLWLARGGGREGRLTGFGIGGDGWMVDDDGMKM